MSVLWLVLTVLLAGGTDAGPPVGSVRYVLLYKRPLGMLNFIELQVFEAGVNVAQNKNCQQSSVYSTNVCGLAVNGNIGAMSGSNGAHTQGGAGTEKTWWQVDLGQDRSVDRTVFHNRQDNGQNSRAVGFVLMLLDSNRRVLRRHDLDNSFVQTFNYLTAANGFGVPAGSDRYQFYADISSPPNAATAESRCSNGLATIPSSVHNALIGSMIQNAPDALVGGREYEGWRWSATSPVIFKGSNCVSGMYCNFKAGSPSNPRLVMESTGTYQWKDVTTSDTEHGYVCKRGGTETNALRSYKYFPYARIKRQTAFYLCRSKGGWLASIPDESAMNAIVAQLSDQGVVPSDSGEFLTGGVLDTSKNKWQWSDGPLALQYYSNKDTTACTWYCNWYDNDDSGAAVMTLWRTTSTRWNDNSDGASDIAGYICEFAGSPTIPYTETNRLRSYMWYPGFKITQFEAQEQCRRKSGWLASIADFAAQLEIDAMLKRENVQIDGSNEALTGGEGDTNTLWKWAFGPLAGTSYANQAADCPFKYPICYFEDNSQTTSGKEVMTINRIGAPSWNDLPDGHGDIKGFICEFGGSATPFTPTVTPPPTPSATITQTDRFQRYIVVPLQSKTQAFAQAHCANLGGWLATIPDLQAQEQVNEVLRHVLVDGDHEIMFGGRWDDSNNKWYWYAGPLKGKFFSGGSTSCSAPFTYCSWSDNGGSSSAPVAAVNSRTSPYWNDNSDADSDLSGFLCEFGRSFTPVPTTTMTLSHSDTDLFERYKYFPHQGVKIREGEQYCSAKGGWLAHIPDSDAMRQAMQALEHVLIDSDHEALFGGEYTAATSQWRWTAGPKKGKPFSNANSNACPNSFGYCSWFDNNDGGAFMVVTIRNRGAPHWNDSPDGDSDVAGYLCEFARSATAVPTATSTPTTSATVSDSETATAEPTPSSTETSSSSLSLSQTSTPSSSHSMSPTGNSESASSSQVATSSITRSVPPTATSTATASTSRTPALTLSSTQSSSASDSSSTSLSPTSSRSLPTNSHSATSTLSKMPTTSNTIPTHSASTSGTRSSSLSTSRSGQSQSCSRSASFSAVPTMTRHRESSTLTSSVTSSISLSASQSLSLTGSFTSSWSTSFTIRSAWLVINSPRLPILHLLERGASVTDVFGGNETNDNSTLALLTDGDPHIVLELEGETLDLVGIRASDPSRRQDRGFALQSSGGNSSSGVATAAPRLPPTPAGHCLSFLASHQEVSNYLNGNVTAQPLNWSAVLIQFRRLPLNASLFTVRGEESVRMTISPSCLKHRLPLPSINFTFVPIPVVEPKKTIVDPKVVEGTKDATQAVQVVAMSVGGGAMATQVARSNLVLTLVECTPDFYTRLGTMQNPFQVSIGPEKYGQYVASCMLNHVIILGVPALHLLWAFIEMKRTGCTWLEGRTAVRFPSLSIIPLMFFLEPTCMAAVVTIIYGEGAGYKFCGVVSLIICVGLVLGMFVHLKRTWAAEMVRGESPSLLKPKKRTAINDDDDLEETEAGWRTTLRRAYGWAAYFIDGGVKWKDHEGHKGYCRRNRLLFMDCTGKWYWFTSAELGIAGLCGLLDGIKLGLHQCNGIVIALIVLLGILFLGIVVLRPYNAPFLLLFSIGVTGIQLLAAVSMGVSMFGGGEAWQEFAETLTLVGIYVIIGRAIFDIVPKVKQMIMQIIKKLCRKEKVNSTHADLTERLLEVVAVEGVENELAAVDHDALVEEEMMKRPDDDELPEIEVDYSQWPEYEWDESQYVPPPVAQDDGIDDLTPFLSGVQRSEEFAPQDLEETELGKKLKKRQQEAAAAHVREEKARESAARAAELENILAAVEGDASASSAKGKAIADDDVHTVEKELSAESALDKRTKFASALNMNRPPSSTMQVAQKPPEAKIKSSETAKLDSMLDALDEADDDLLIERRHSGVDVAGSQREGTPGFRKAAQPAPETKKSSGDAALDALLDQLEEEPARTLAPDDDDELLGKAHLGERARSAKAVLGSWGRNTHLMAPPPPIPLKQTASCIVHPTSAVARPSCGDDELDRLLDGLENDELDDEVGDGSTSHDGEVSEKETSVENEGDALMQDPSMGSLPPSASLGHDPSSSNFVPNATSSSRSNETPRLDHADDSSSVEDLDLGPPRDAALVRDRDINSTKFVRGNQCAHDEEEENHRLSVL